MRKLLENRKFILAIGLVAILAVILLASGISSLKFNPAEPFYVSRGSEQPSTPLQPADRSLFWQSILIWSAVLLMILLTLYAFLNKSQRKKSLRSLIRFLFMMGIISFMGLFYEDQQISPTPTPSGDESAASVSNLPEFGKGATPSVFVPPQVMPWVSYAVTLGIILAVLVGVVGYLWWRYKHIKSPGRELGEIAQSTLDDLQAGKDWSDSVIQCYLRMGIAVRNWRGIRRQEDITSSEFALQLQEAGLPADAVRRLTTLFEAVRYGDKASTKKEIDEAVACLSEIVQVCRVIS